MKRANAKVSLTTPSSAVARSRTNGKACVTCHRRKVKCDILTKGIPCSNCRSHNAPNCQTYTRKSTRHSPSSTSAPSLQRPGIRNETLLGSESSPTAPIPASDGDGDDVLQQDARLQEESSPEPNSIEDGDPETRNLSEFLSENHRKTRDVTHETRLYYIGSETSTLNYLIRQRPAESGTDVLHFSTEARPRVMPELKGDCLRLPGRNLMGELISAYFTNVNRGFPIVDEEDFFSRYDGKDPARPLSLLLLNAILLVGAHSVSPSKPEVRKMEPDFLRRARQLYDGRHEVHREYYMQAALLFTWYCDHLEDVVSNSWLWVGVATRTAYGMGMHRDTCESALPLRLKHMWNRLWWTMFQFDVMVSAAHGRPQAMDLDLSDVPDLDPSDFEEVPGTDVDFAIQHTKLCRILSKAMKGRASLRVTAEDRQDVTDGADRELASFYTSLPSSMQLSLISPNPWACLLHLTYNYTLLLLHRPPPRPNERIPQPTDASICSDAVATITAIFDSLRERDMLGGLWIPCAYIIFAALVQLSGQVRSDNPLVVASSQRLFETLLKTLKALTSKWPFARSLMLVFRNPKLQQGPSAPATAQPQSYENQADTPSDPLMLPTPDSGAPEIARQFGNGQLWPVASANFGPSYTDISMDHASYGPSMDVFGGQSGWPMSFDATAGPLDLEFLLAGIGNEYGL